MISFINRRLIVLLISIIALVILAGLTLGARGNPTWPEKFVKDTVSLLQGVVYKPASAVVGFVENVKKIYYLYEENRALKATLLQFAQLQANVEMLEKENKRLREMLDAKTSLRDYRLRAASVIARHHETWYNLVTINKGERDGIRPNMAVITPAGMVGVVQNVSYFSSNVRLLTDVERGSYISAMVLGNEETFGIIEAYDVEKQALVMRKIPLEAALEPGQKVVTSGLGGVFPRGLLIGEVLEILPGEYGLTKMAYIKPAADLYRLDEVFVVERTEGDSP